ncbi:MAG: hypothetical protein QW039_06405 [Fervidicoccaceae archaeon]
MCFYNIEARSKLIDELRKLNLDREAEEKALRLLDAVYSEVPNIDSDAVVLSVLKFIGANAEALYEKNREYGARKWEESELILPLILRVAREMPLH